MPGFVLYPKSPRFVTPQRAAELARRLPPLVTPVLLFVNASATEIEAAAAIVTPAILQFHGDESPQACMAAAQQAHCPFWRAARIPSDIASGFDLLEFAYDYSAAQASCWMPRSMATAAAERHSIGHACQQTFPLTSSCLVGSHLQTWALACRRCAAAGIRSRLTSRPASKPMAPAASRSRASRTPKKSCALSPPCARATRTLQD
jgi:hypothetical protein